MALCKLLENTINKMMEIKLNAPLTKIYLGEYLCKIAYCDLFRMMFLIDLETKINTTDNMIDDIENYKKYLKEFIFGDFRIFNYNEEFNINGIHQQHLLWADRMLYTTITYIKNLCDIVLLKTINFTEKDDKNILIYYILIRFIPIYFEITTGIYNALSDNEKNNIIDNLNKFIKIKINKNDIYFVPNFLSYIYYFKQESIIQLLDFINNVDINKYYNDIQLYTKNIKSTEYVSIKSTESIIYYYEPKIENNKIKSKNIDIKSIPKNIRSLVWDLYVGEDKGIGTCYVCNSKINSKHFECGHIIARANSGSSNVENLRPICSLCNKSIGSRNMDDFKKIYIK